MSIEGARHTNAVCLTFRLAGIESDGVQPASALALSRSPQPRAPPAGAVSCFSSWRPFAPASGPA